MLTQQPEQTSTYAQLTFIGPNNFMKVERLTDDDNLLVGSSTRCAIRLDHVDIAPIHCLLRLEGTALAIQQWSTSAAMFVNGARVEGEVKVASGGKICMGEFQIHYSTVNSDGEIVEVEGVGVEEVGVEEVGVEQEEIHEEIHEVTTDDLAAPEARLPDAAPSSELESRDVSHETPSSAAPLEQLLDEFSAQTEDEPPAVVETAVDSPPELDAHLEPDDTIDRAALYSQSPLDSFDQETMSMLYAEVQQLQGELAQRDAQIAELMSSAGPAGEPAGDQISESETAALVARLEELLDENERGDERVRVMEDVLQDSEEAHHAEQEERAQLEAWVSEIEKRIGQREDECKAEMATLEHRIQVITSERDHVERRLHQAGSPEAARAESESVLTQLREQNAELQDKLDMAEKAHIELEKRTIQLEHEHANKGQNLIEDALREERAKLAQERAEVTRVRAEVSAKLADTDSKDGGKSQEIDTKLRAYREHLREIHAEEKQEKSERTLSSRIASIWKRLDT